MRSISQGAKGIGLRSELIESLCQQPWAEVDFLELAPENWMGIGGYKGERLEALAARYPLVAHGLNLSLGDAQPLNLDFIRRVRDFLDRYQIALYSEHLSFSRDHQGYLYDLLPVPRHQENIPYLADRIHRVQDLLGRQLVLENISYYHRYRHEMPEAEFFCELIARTGCGMLLDINNAYVNGCNHHYDPLAFIAALPSHAIRYYHIAGHAPVQGQLLDTHGMPVSRPVIELARATVKRHGMRPLLLERDHHLPPLPTLLNELAAIHGELRKENNHDRGTGITA